MVAELAVACPADPTGDRVPTRCRFPRRGCRPRAASSRSGRGSGDGRTGGRRCCCARRGSSSADADAAELVEQTEGWPAGLYLAALASRGAASTPAIGATFTGDDRFMGDYLRSEFLDRVSRADVAFLTRSAVLDRMCGPLCDAVVGAHGPSRVLDRLERRNLLVIPLDRKGGWYRYHHLFRELLHAELLRREPEVLPELHRRAAAWYEANGHAGGGHRPRAAAGDAERVARLVLRSPTRCGRAGASTRCCAGWSGSRRTI